MQKNNFEAFSCRHFNFKNSAPECTRTRHFHSENWKFFWGGGTAPSPYPSPSGRGTNCTSDSARPSLVLSSADNPVFAFLFSVSNLLLLDDVHHLPPTNNSTARHKTQSRNYRKTRMWANVQRDDRPAEYRWRPQFNAAAKFGWRPLVECRAVTLPRRETRWN